jgi:hypothetical protein
MNPFLRVSILVMPTFSGLYGTSIYMLEIESNMEADFMGMCLKKRSSKKGSQESKYSPHCVTDTIVFTQLERKLSGH